MSTTAGTAAMTRAEYDALPPFEQGYATYMWACHEGSQVPNKCPYDALREATQKAEFERGEFAAILAVQDLDD